MLYSKVIIYDNMRVKKSQELISDFESKHIKSNRLFSVGDSISIGYSPKEGANVENMSGIIIRVKGQGLGKSFTIKSSSEGINFVQTFPIYSPLLHNVEKKLSHKVCRSKLYYLNKLFNKNLKIKP